MKEKVKNGYCTVYEGKEYRIARNSVNDTFELISYDDEDLQHGFVDITKRFKGYISFMLAKKVNLSEIGEVYRVYTYAIYHGHNIAIESTTDKGLLLTTTDKIFYEKYGFEETERFVYRKTVSFDEVELAEERRPARYIESAKTFV